MNASVVPAADALISKVFSVTLQGDRARSSSEPPVVFLAALSEVRDISFRVIVSDQIRS